IQYHAANVDEKSEGAWNLGDQKRDRELFDFVEKIAVRVRDAARDTPLPVVRERPRMRAVRNAFVPPLPLAEFDTPGMTAGPNTVTFVYASINKWDAWPWAPPIEQAALHVAAAIAKGNDMESNQLTFTPATDLAGRLAALRRGNNVVILLVDAATL